MKISNEYKTYLHSLNDQQLQKFINQALNEKERYTMRIMEAEAKRKQATALADMRASTDAKLTYAKELKMHRILKAEAII
jgi:hypothetical protein